MLNVKQGGIKYHFCVFGMTQPGIEPRSPGPVANTLLIRPIVIYEAPCFDVAQHRMNETPIEIRTPSCSFPC